MLFQGVGAAGVDGETAQGLVEVELVSEQEDVIALAQPTEDSHVQESLKNIVSVTSTGVL